MKEKQRLEAIERMRMLGIHENAIKEFAEASYITLVYSGMEQPFELGESGSKSYLDQEAPTSISRGSSL